MRRYAAGAGCLMAFLQEALDDPSPVPCGRCSVCTGELPEPGAAPSPERVDLARRFVRGVDVVIEPRKRWPGGVARRGTIVGASEGRAVAFGDDPGWSGELAHLDRADRSGLTEPVPAALLDAAVETLRRWKSSWTERPVAVVPLPDPYGSSATRMLAAHLASIGSLPMLDVLEWAGSPAPADVASAATVVHLESVLSVSDPASVPSGPVMLVAASMRTGWSLTLAAALLREAGCREVLPLVLHRRP
jgi:ATP-dependent DNA helicase RecQ